MENQNQDRQVATDMDAPSTETPAQEQQQRPQSQQQQQMRQEFEPAEQRQTSPSIERQTGQQGGGGLIGGQEMDRFSSQWTSIQAAFVDEPKKAVAEADRLVEDVIKHLTTTFANERQKLEGQWSRGDSASTEDLRVALQRNRQFFQSLLRT